MHVAWTPDMLDNGCFTFGSDVFHIDVMSSALRAVCKPVVCKSAVKQEHKKQGRAQCVDKYAGNLGLLHTLPLMHCQQSKLRPLQVLPQTGLEGCKTSARHSQTCSK